MAGTKTGGLKAAQTNKKKYGEDFYRNIGAKGGSAAHSKPRGFAAMSPERVRELGKLGGHKSIRGKAKK